MSMMMMMAMLISMMKAIAIFDDDIAGSVNDGDVTTFFLLHCRITVNNYGLNARLWDPRIVTSSLEVFARGAFTPPLRRRFGNGHQC